MTLNKAHLYVVILCGGGGTRLWPLSRHSTPKQFIELVSEETLFEKTLKRAHSLVPWDHIFIITHTDYLSDVTRLADDVPPNNIITEPVKRNTALAMGLSAGIIQKADPQAVIVNFASDHLISNTPEFDRVVLAAAETAQTTQSLVSIGITPTFAHPGLGYIHRGPKIQDLRGIPVYTVEGFREKPSAKIAADYLTTGEYYWNANLYTWTASSILAEFKTHAPAIAGHIHTITQALSQPDFDTVLTQEYHSCPEEQIDTAISEKTHKLVVIPGDFGWTDIGSWNVVHDEATKDAAGNALIEREEGAAWIPLSTSNSLVSVGRKLVVTIGVDHLMIIDTPDALLITTKDRAQDVKKVVETLKNDDRDTLL